MDNDNNNIDNEQGQWFFWLGADGHVDMVTMAEFLVRYNEKRRWANVDTSDLEDVDERT